LRDLIDKALKRGYVLLPLAAPHHPRDGLVCSRPCTGLGLSALSPAAVEATTLGPMRSRRPLLGTSAAADLAVAHSVPHGFRSSSHRRAGGCNCCRFISTVSIDAPSALRSTVSDSVRTRLSSSLITEARLPLPRSGGLDSSAPKTLHFPSMGRTADHHCGKRPGDSGATRAGRRARRDAHGSSDALLCR
jgi:hypothetical protein